jgi:hypothetical protein
LVGPRQGSIERVEERNKRRRKKLDGTIILEEKE